MPELRHIAVLIDPAVSTNAESAETGIMVGGVTKDGTTYILEDATIAGTPSEWAEQAVRVAAKHDADVIAVEDNQGGDLLEHVLREAQIHARRRFRIERVRATRSKWHRWGMAATTWEQGRVIHVGTPRQFVQLEHQLLSMTPDLAEKKQKLDRGDAAVWLVLYLSGVKADSRISDALGNRDAWAEIRKQMRRRSR